MSLSPIGLLSTTVSSPWSGVEWSQNRPACSLSYTILYSYMGVDVKSQAFLERVAQEFHGVSPQIRVFRALDWFEIKFSRRSELKTILPFVTIVQRQIISGRRDMLSGLFSRGIATVCQFSKATLHNQNFTFIPLHGYLLE